MCTLRRSLCLDAYAEDIQKVYVENTKNSIVCMCVWELRKDTFVHTEKTNSRTILDSCFIHNRFFFFFFFFSITRKGQVRVSVTWLVPSDLVEEMFV